MKSTIWIFALFFCLNTVGQNNNEFYQKALKYASINNIEEALSTIEKAINLEGDKTPELFYFHKYEYLVKLQKIDLGLQTLNHALYKLPNSVLLLNTRAEHFLVFKVYKKAVLDYQKITTLVKGKDFVGYKLKLASCKFSIRDFEGVALVLQEIFKEDPSNVEALNLLASLYVELLNYTKAEQILYKLINENNSQIFAIINLGYVYQKKGKHQEAVSCFNRALKLDPNNPIALSNRAYSELIMSNIDEAFLDINKSIDLLPSNTYAYMIRGKIYLSINNIREACMNFAIAKHLNFSEQYGGEVNELIVKNCQ
ncbi:tetratricopeptide repeat protein [Flavobacterium poyangense]|uniref:tetratricopeptide repeat protein n=1 Tax=Flavobacterium poyangense TaxID=2204302 RepID=UPI0014206F83|nr:tetratricopeptide repeat protein [Flavobacterium sp. JXAS1]